MKRPNNGVERSRKQVAGFVYAAESHRPGSHRKAFRRL